MTLKQLFTGLAITSAFALLLGGCSAGPQPVDTDVVQKNADANTRVKSIYDAAGGDFDKVPDGDKKFLIDRYKNEEGARKAFDLIKNPPGGLPGAPSPNQ